MQEVTLNYYNGALRPECFELCTENCTGGPIARSSWESLPFVVENCLFSHGGGGGDSSVGWSQRSSSVLKQVLCSMSTIQEYISQGTGGIKVGTGGVSLNSCLCYYLKKCLTKWW